MKTYLVTWAIDISADSPQEAAAAALAIQRDRDSSATVFDVIEHDSDGSAVKVDISEEAAPDGLWVYHGPSGLTVRVLRDDPSA